MRHAFLEQDQSKTWQDISKKWDFCNFQISKNKTKEDNEASCSIRVVYSLKTLKNHGEGWISSSKLGGKGGREGSKEDSEARFAGFDGIN